jgi:hypothetical protein
LIAPTGPKRATRLATPAESIDTGDFYGSPWIYAIVASNSHNQAWSSPFRSSLLADDDFFSEVNLRRPATKANNASPERLRAQEISGGDFNSEVAVCSIS